MTTSAVDTQREQNLSIIHRFFSLLHEKDIARWSTLWDDNGRIWVPYPVAGFPTTIEGKTQIVAAFQQLFAGFVSFDPHIVDIYPTLDPDVIVVEWSGSAQLRATGQMYQSNPITVFKFRGGRIVTYHDYFNPEKFQVVVDALNALS
jgi:uncharacterized protein